MWANPPDTGLLPYEFDTETSVSQLSIVPAPPGGSGNALRVSFTATESLDRPSCQLVNRLARRLGIAWTLTIVPDTDGDGLPDEWETANALDPADPSDALLDSDGDGINNLAEYRSGTIATSALSGLWIETVRHENGKATLGFQAAANRTYTIEASTQASGGTWEKAADVVAKPASSSESISHDVTGESMRFYRIVTPRRP
jgi:hypothetical protein